MDGVSQRFGPSRRLSHDLRFCPHWTAYSKHAIEIALATVPALLRVVPYRIDEREKKNASMLDRNSSPAGISPVGGCANTSVLDEEAGSDDHPGGQRLKVVHALRDELNAVFGAEQAIGGQRFACQFIDRRIEDDNA